MKQKLNVDWFWAAFVRALRTMAQTALGMFTVGAAMSDINWIHVLSVSVVALIYSFLTSLATSLPEVANDGVMEIDSHNPNIDIYNLDVGELSSLKNKKFVRIKIDPDAHIQPGTEMATDDHSDITKTP